MAHNEKAHIESNEPFYKKILRGFNSNTLPFIIPVAVIGVIATGLFIYIESHIEAKIKQRLASTPYLAMQEKQEYAKIADINRYSCSETPSLATGDLTGDGLVDIALAYEDKVLLLQNEGSNKFTKPKEIPTIDYALLETPSISISDMNGDSLKDVIVSDSSIVLLYLNNGLNAEGTVTFRYAN